MAVVVSVALLGGQGAALADHGADNVVEVQNTSDNSLRAQSRAVVTHSPGGTVSNTNAAYATSSCVNCRTAAVAVQMLIVEGPVGTNAAVNVSLAVNQNCDTCQTFAYAHQVIFLVGRPVRLGGRALDRIESIQEDIDDVVRSRHDFPTMEAELDSLTDQMAAVVRAEISRSGRGNGEQDHRDVHDHEGQT
jgi:hypothetical protein